ncbi:hypothetical protein N9M53_06840, partial [Alphaproteobacteria bacterium]|nr:hypothetical protein [Alphaproteobacteria bacterium]
MRIAVIGTGVSGLASSLILDIAAGHHAIYMRWTMTGQISGYPKQVLHLDGMSEIHFNDDGLVTKHIDHW